MNTILNPAKKVLGRAKVSALDSARFVRNILDAKPSDSKLTDAQFVLKVIDVGLRHIRTNEMSLTDGFALYLKIKQHLRPDSIRDIRCIGNECEEWLISGQTKASGIFSRVCNVFAETGQSLCVNGKPAYKAALFSGKCFYAERGENGFEDRRIVEAAEFTRIDLEFDKSAILETLDTLPTTFQMVGKFTKASYNWAKSGFKLADEAELARRTQICNKCKFWYPTARMGLGKCRMPYREVVKKSLSGFRKALLVFGCYEILLSSAICCKSQRQRAENRRIRRGLGHLRERVGAEPVNYYARDFVRVVD